MWLVGWFPGSVHRRVSSFSSFFWRVIVVVWNFLVQGSRGPGVVVLAAAAAASHACLQHHNRTRQGGVLRCVASCPMPSIHPSIHPPSTSPCLSVCPIDPPSSLFPSYITRTKYPLFSTNKPKPTPPKPTTQPAPGRLTAIGSRLCKSMVSGTDTLHPAGLAKCPCPALPLLHSIQTT